jgi:tetratricopeptide (TPR) repeat protein
LKKSLKKQIKQDELASGYASMGAWLSAHVDEARSVTIGALVLALALGGLLYFRGQRLQDSQRAFDEALTAFAAPVAQTDAAASAAAKQEKLNKALTAFEGVAGRFKSLSAGQRARYYAALCRIELGQSDEAGAALREIAGQPKSGAIEPGLAEMTLARLERAQRNYAQALSRYEQLLAAPSAGLPRDYILMNLAETLQEGGRLADAAAAFKRVAEEMPTSPFASDARTRADYLKLAAGK